MVMVSMARNDVRHALFKAGRSNAASEPDFTYWVRLSTAHFFEAIAAVRIWRRLPEVKAFLSRVPAAARDDLKAATRSLEQIGNAVVAHSRNRTFHYPYPSGRYPADGELEAALENVGTAEAQWVVEDEGRFRLKFADEVALALALGKHEPSQIERQLELVRDGSVAFVNFATRAMETYLQERGFNPRGAERSAEAGAPQSRRRHEVGSYDGLDRRASGLLRRRGVNRARQLRLGTTDPELRR